MLKFIANLFAAKTAARKPNLNARLSLDAMETRYAPALLNPGVIRGFNPQPEPPGDVALVRGIIAIQPVETSGIVTRGG